MSKEKSIRKKKERLRRERIEKRKKAADNKNIKPEEMTLFDEIITDNTYLVWGTLLVCLLGNFIIFSSFFILKKTNEVSDNILFGVVGYFPDFYILSALIAGFFIYSFNIKKENDVQLKKVIDFYIKATGVSVLLFLGVYFSFNSNVVYLKNIIINWLFLTNIILSGIMINKFKNRYCVFIIPVFLLVIYVYNYFILIMENMPYLIFLIWLLGIIIFIFNRPHILNKIAMLFKESNESLPKNNNWYKSSRVISMFAVIITFSVSYYFIIVLCIYGPRFLNDISQKIEPMDKRKRNRALLDLFLNILIIIVVYYIANIKSESENLFNILYNNI